MARMNYSRNERNRLSDHDIFLDMLTTEKYMSHIYDHAVLESSGDLIRDTFQTLQQTTQSNAQKLYETMQQHGWYKSGTSNQSRNPKVSASQSGRKNIVSSNTRKTYANPGLNGTHRGKSGISVNAPRYIEQYNTPQ